jgi:cystathionine beta-lyase
MSRSINDGITLEALRARTSTKWRTYDPDVIPAWVAEMDFVLAEPIAAVLHEAVSASDTGYRWVGELPQALAGFARRTWSWDLNPEHVMALPDVLTCVVQALEALTRVGDGVVINTPVYPPFFSTVRDITKRTVVDVPLARDTAGRYSFDLDALATAFARPDVTAYLLCSPHNPTGTTPSAEELTTIALLAQRHRVVVIADEIHAPLAHPGTVHTPFLSVCPSDLTAVSLISASKAWNIAGLKCAQIIAGSQSVMDTLVERVPIETTYATGHFGVLAAIAAYSDGEPWLDQVREQIAENARIVQAHVSASMPGVRTDAPASSYLAWLDFTETEWAPDPAEFLLARARVGVSAGAPFGEASGGFVRLNFGTSPAILEVILERMSSALNGGT